MDEFESKVAEKFATITGTAAPADDRGMKLGLCIAADELLAKRTVYLRMGLTGFKKQLNDEVCSELLARARGLLERAGVNPNEWFAL